MNSDIQPAGILLAELREAYRSLPKPIQVRVANLLRKSAMEEEPGEECAS